MLIGRRFFVIFHLAIELAIDLAIDLAHGRDNPFVIARKNGMLRFNNACLTA
ncbi:hypothetical protein ABEW34_20900 [Paenibacillus algorifonticola]|uniref:hypothetical protein n=1 Tax=Paenibacillus algorifonticola TaxID=684063 RepID=UPI003D2BD219